MSELIIYVDQSEIRDGKFEELKQGMKELVAFIERNEPQILAYHVYFSEDRKRMTVIHVHAEAASLDFHMEVGSEEFPKFAEFIEMASIDIYGKPNDAVVERLREKAQTLGSGVVRIHEHYDGVDRLARTEELHAAGG